MNFLATVGDCFIILGIARRQVENCVAIGFKNFIVEGMEQEEYGLLRPGPLIDGEAATIEVPDHLDDGRGLDPSITGRMRPASVQHTTNEDLPDTIWKS